MGPRVRYPNEFELTEADMYSALESAKKVQHFFSEIVPEMAYTYRNKPKINNRELKAMIPMR